MGVAEAPKCFLPSLAIAHKASPYWRLESYEWTVGGSSSGAGAAAAAGFGVVHLGTDIGGSVRLSAAWTGVATLKPSNGRIPLDNPYFGRSAGPLAGTVADVALGMHAVARPDERDYTSLPDDDIDWFDLDTDVGSPYRRAHRPGYGHSRRHDRPVGDELFSPTASVSVGGLNASRESLWLQVH